MTVPRTDIGADLAEHLDAEERAAIEERLPLQYTEEAIERSLRETNESWRNRIKAWHEKHPDDVLMDDTRQYVVSFIESSKGDETDLIALAEHASGAETLVALARAGLLTCRVTGLRPLAGKSAWADLALRFTHRAGTKTTLRIERVEREGTMPQ